MALQLQMLHQRQKVIPEAISHIIGVYDASLTLASFVWSLKKAGTKLNVYVCTRNNESCMSSNLSSFVTVVLLLLVYLVAVQ